MTCVTHWLARCTYQRWLSVTIAIIRGCIMLAIKLPNVTATFFVTLIALMLIIGLLFWAVGTR